GDCRHDLARDRRDAQASRRGSAVSRVVGHASGNIAGADGGISRTGTRAVAPRGHRHARQSRMTAESSLDATLYLKRIDDARDFIKLINDGSMSQAACAAAELGIADLLASGPKPVQDLSQACG